MPGDAQPANQGSETAFTVEDGKTYEVIERVYGHNVEIRAKTVGESSESEPLRDNVRARYGGIGIQVLPGAEVIFDTLTIKVLS